MNALQKIALAFTIIGALNWGMIGLFDFNLVTAIFGVDGLFTKLIYVFVGLAGLVNIGLLVTPIKMKGE